MGCLTCGPTRLGLFLGLFLGLTACATGERTDAGGSEDGGTLAPPVRLALLEPRTGLLTSADRIRVTGQLSGTTAGSVEVNGIPATLTGSVFEVSALPLIEGVNLVLARHQPSGATDQLQLVRDQLGPQITITEPARGSYWPGQPAAVRLAAEVLDLHGPNMLTLAGHAQVLQDPAAGWYSVPLELAPGMHRLEVVAWDELGNENRAAVRVLCGDFVSPGLPLTGAIELFFGLQALSTLGEAVAQAIDRLELTELAQAQGPLNLGESLTLTVVAIEHAPGAAMQVLPQDGALQVKVQLGAFQAQVVSSGKITQTGYLQLDGVEVQGRLVFRLGSGGMPEFTLEKPEVVLTGLRFGLAADQDLLELLGELRQLVEEELEHKLTEMAASALSELTTRSLARLLEPIRTTVLGWQVTIRLVPEELAIDRVGVRLTVGAELELDGRTSWEPPVVPGYLATPATAVPLPPTPGVMVAVSDDLLNLLFHELWRGGLMTLELTQEELDRQKLELDLVAGFLGPLLEGLTPRVDPEALIRLRLRPLLPPVVRLSAAGPHPLVLQVGELQMDVLLDGPVERTLLSVSTSLDAAIGVTVERGLLRLTLGQTEPQLLSVGGEAHELASRLLDPAAALFLASLQPLLDSLVVAVPLASFEGLVLEDLEMTGEGGGPDQLVAWGCLGLR